MQIPGPFTPNPPVYSDRDAPRPRYGPRIVPAPGPPRAPTPVLSTDNSQGYFGSSPPNSGDTAPADFIETAIIPNTRWTAGELATRYQQQHPTIWARGILNSSDHIMSTLGDMACREDVLCQALNHQHQQFARMALYLFSVPSLFVHIVKVGGYPVGSAPMPHYDSLTDNMTLFLAAAWYVTHSIAPGSAAVLALKEFSRARRNMLAGNNNLENTTWAVDEMDAVATLSFGAPHIPLCADIYHAPQRPNVPDNNGAGNNDTTATNPGAGLAASAHVHMEGVTFDGAAKPKSPTEE
ncbi:hypothetical protein DFH06DRAFT_1130306 [Mycena polygramma]|nr:hypothetical protein DFH06DRAFT_1130306 [Mycena polygramma]